MQEFMVQVDWGWITLIMNVFDYQTTMELTQKAMIAKELETMKVLRYPHYILLHWNNPNAIDLLELHHDGNAKIRIAKDVLRLLAPWPIEGTH